MATVIDHELRLGIVEHMAALRRYARFLTRNPDQAEDLVQDCIARALSRPHLYRLDTNLRGWLFTMLRNISISQNRKLRIRQAYAAERMAIGADATAPNQVQCVALGESLRLIKALRAPERQAIALLGIFEMTYKEAAQHAGQNVGTIKSRLSRGRAHLRTLAAPVRKVA